ncbi:MAG: pyridoxal-phosphate dependent enzyme [Hymenobacter sp.]
MLHCVQHDGLFTAINCFCPDARPASLRGTTAVTLENVEAAARRLRGVIAKTPLMLNLGLSRTYDATILLKREDLQVVRSYKIRGAYNKIAALPATVPARQIVCASAGNHAQGVAYACQLAEPGATFSCPPRRPPRRWTRCACSARTW